MVGRAGRTYEGQTGSVLQMLAFWPRQE